MNNTRSGPLDRDESTRNEHQRVWTLLPWIVNGSASAEQRAAAQTHLEHCGDCRAELQAQQQVRRGLNVQPSAVSLDCDAGLRRLLARLDAELEEQPIPASPVRRKRSPLMMAMAAAICAQAIGLGVFGMRHSNDESFRTLSQGEIPVEAATLSVVPGPSMTMAEWHALLDAHGLLVVNGPNSLGAYDLARRSGRARSTEELVARLREAPGISFVEPITRTR